MTCRPTSNSLELDPNYSPSILKPGESVRWFLGYAPFWFLGLPCCNVRPYISLPSGSVKSKRSRYDQRPSGHVWVAVCEIVNPRSLQSLENSALLTKWQSSCCISMYASSTPLASADSARPRNWKKGGPFLCKNQPDEKEWEIEWDEFWRLVGRNASKYVSWMRLEATQQVDILYDS